MDGVTVFVGVLVGVTGIQLFMSHPSSSIIEIQYDDSVNADGSWNEKGRSESFIVEINSQFKPNSSHA